MAHQQRRTLRSSITRDGFLCNIVRSKPFIKASQLREILIYVTHRVLLLSSRSGLRTSTPAKLHSQGTSSLNELGLGRPQRNSLVVKRRESPSVTSEKREVLYPLRRGQVTQAPAAGLRVGLRGRMEHPQVRDRGCSESKRIGAWRVKGAAPSRASPYASTARMPRTSPRISRVHFMGKHLPTRRGHTKRKAEHKI
jgi:hypothetical protein